MFYRSEVLNRRNMIDFNKMTHEWRVFEGLGRGIKRRKWVHDRAVLEN